MSDAAIPIPHSGERQSTDEEQKAAKRLKLAEEDKPQVVEKVMEDGVIPIPVSTDEEQLKVGEEDKVRVREEMMRSFINRYDKDNEDEEAHIALMQHYRPIFEKDKEAWDMIPDYLEDHLPAFMRNEYSDERLKDLHLTRKELDLTRQERLNLSIGRQMEAVRAKPGYHPYVPEYGPDDPLPPGHVWAPNVPGSGEKDHVVLMKCCICWGDHWAQDCPRPDDPPPPPRRWGRYAKDVPPK